MLSLNYHFFESCHCHFISFFSLFGWLKSIGSFHSVTLHLHTKNWTYLHTELITEISHNDHSDWSTASVLLFHEHVLYKVNLNFVCMTKHAPLNPTEHGWSPSARYWLPSDLSLPLTVSFVKGGLGRLHFGCEAGVEEASVGEGGGWVLPIDCR